MFALVTPEKIHPMMNIVQMLIECFQIASDRNTSAAIGDLR